MLPPPRGVALVAAEVAGALGAIVGRVLHNRQTGASHGYRFGIFLMVVGAMLTFAINTTVEAVNLDAVGWICMIAGAAAI